MTFDKLAELVAADFQKTMDEEGFESFDEMRRCYCWEISDIKEEVSCIVGQLAKDLNGDFWMSDDMSFLQIGIDDMTWGNFKKLVFSHMKGA